MVLLDARQTVALMHEVGPKDYAAQQALALRLYGLPDEADMSPGIPAEEPG